MNQETTVRSLHFQLRQDNTTNGSGVFIPLQPRRRFRYPFAGYSLGSMKIKTAISVLAVMQMLYPVLVSPHDFALLQEPTKPQALRSAPRCEAIGTSELTMTCAYTAGSSVDADRRTTPRIILNSAVISFIPSDESHMRVELAFTNDSGSKIVDQRTVYLAIDDEKGENHMRRSLPHVDFTKLEPGKLTKFQETLLAPAFSPGPYIVSIWIPSTDLSLKFDPTYNLLLSSKGVPNPATGLNLIAEFTVTASGRRKSAAKPD